MSWWRRRYVSRHGAPLRFGRADPGQQNELFVDFALAVGLAVVVVMGPLLQVSLLAYIVVTGLGVAVVLLWLRYRTATVAVTMDDEALNVRNVFRSYRIPIASVTKIVSRQSWIGGMYAFCFGVRTCRRLDALPGRSVPLHALTGADRQEDQLRALLPGCRPQRAAN
jgi:hypothetical protein